jgi:regulator of protease activity HflC (stomatin/prohibitin superfamily)
MDGAMLSACAEPDCKLALSLGPQTPYCLYSVFLAKLVSLVVFVFVGVQRVAQADEVKAKMEEIKGETNAKIEEAKGEAKALTEEAKGNKMQAAMERAKGKTKAAGERMKGTAKQLKAKTE